MSNIPKDKGFDATLALLKEGYLFISNRRRRYNTDIFQARLLLEKAIFISGPEAAQFFYDNAHFYRQGALPGRVQRTLTGKNGLQSLDGELHQRRKAMFMALMQPESRETLMQRIESHWCHDLALWRKQEQIILLPAMQEILFKAACDWAGVEYSDADVKPCAHALGDMVNGFGGVGPRYWKGRTGRLRMERWATAAIEKTRKNRATEEVTPLQRIVWHRDEKGSLMDTKVAAIELLNLIRPIVAIATYIAFIAHALQRYPWTRDLLIPKNHYTHAFVQEVRRYYPFTPFVGARVKEDCRWKDYHLPKNRLVILDVYGIDHDPRIWNNPDAFMPERFLIWKENDFTFIPQGGGDPHTGHRCAGEEITVDAMKLAAEFLVELHYNVPVQDLSINLTNIPTGPKSNIILQNIRLAQRSSAPNLLQAA